MNAALSMSQSTTASKIDYAVARKALDNQEMQGAAMVQLIQAAGQVGDKSGATMGLGAAVDVYA